jgi:hypothetical protein
MIDFRLAVARIGYVFLTVWTVGWISFFAWGMIFQRVDWSEWPTLAATVFGYPRSIFLLWRLYLWMNSDFVRSDWQNVLFTAAAWRKSAQPCRFSMPSWALLLQLIAFGYYWPMGEPAKIDDLLNRYRGLEGLGVQLGQHDVFARPGESIPNKSEPGRRAIPRWAHTIFAMTFASVLAASPFWVALPLQLAAILAAIIFPAMVLAYIIAMGS